MDIGASFTYMFDDQDWMKKLAIGGGILFVATVTSPFLVGIALFFPILGYMIEVIRNVRGSGQGSLTLDKNSTILPEWDDFGGLFMTGAKAAVVVLVYIIPVLIVICPFILIMFASPVLGLDPNTMGTIVLIATICLMCLVPLVSLVSFGLMPAGLIRFAEYDTIGSAFEFGAIVSFISANLGNYIIAILLASVASFVAGFGLLLCGIGIFFTNFWALLVGSHLYGQLARER